LVPILTQRGDKKGEGKKDLMEQGKNKTGSATLWVKGDKKSIMRTGQGNLEEGLSKRGDIEKHWSVHQTEEGKRSVISNGKGVTYNSQEKGGN